MNKRSFRIILNLVLICGLIAPSIIVRPNSAWGMTDEPSASTFRLYLTHVLRQNQADRVRLRNLGVVTLAEEENDLTLVIVTSDQLEDLARLNFRPHNTQDLAYLLEKGAAPGWLRTSLHPLLVKAATLDQELARHPEGLSDEALVMQTELGNMLYGLTAEQKLGLAKLDTVDSDNDGLNDTEEDWWCTDPTDPDSDDDGVEDGQEVDQLMAGNKTNGKPFLDWPPNIPGCYDDDQDSVPDLAETNVVGLSVNRESSDLDKYDDGQEFFGSTYCPGGAGACGYGTLPRTDDLYLGSNMPSFVEAPADSPFVAAFPDPSVSVVDGSLNVEAVTVVTTDHTIEESESHYYSTTTTSGTSTTTTDVESWNDWEEVPTTDSEVAAAFHDIGLHLDNIESRLSPDAALTIGTIIAGAGLLLAVSPAMESNMNIMDRFCYRDRPFLLGGAQCKAHEWLYGPPQKTGETITNITNNYYQTNYGTSTCDTSGQQPQGDTCNAEGMYTPSYGEAILTDSNSPDRQESPITQEGMNYHTDANNELIGNRSYSGSYPSTVPDQDPVYTIEFDGRRSTTTYEYSETTITQREEFSSFESWSEATAVDSAHAADLRFTYAILNDGTDILREMDELLFNIYLGGDPNPIYTYNAIADTGTLSNINPGDEVTIASQPIPLTLQQMKAIDQGASILITVEQVAYGGDQVFFEDAVNGGLIVGVEDGWADGDDVLDLYVLPCFGNPCGSDPNETVQTIVQRGFTTEEDPNGNLLSITTPEVDGSAVDWVEHRLDYTSWWNFYLSDNLEYTGAFSTTMPLAGEAVVMRFLDDTDLDGYNDRTETILGTDPDDAGSHPQPELLAGAVSERTGDDIKVTMAFLNTGPYDATGVEVVAYAPDDTITLHDNTIGGSGRVGSGNRVVLGGRVKDPVVDNWTGSATPMSSGVFSGTVDTTYTFTAQGGGDIGSGNLLIDWNDGVNSGSLQVGDGYLSPLPLNVGDLGVQVAFNTGTVNAGDSFTVDARPPGDTITYTVTSEPYTPPVLVVSYNDPQGNHRFITPITMTTVSDDLSVYSGEMIEDLELSITTVAEFDETGTNTTYYITNSPDEATIEDAHLFVEYINDEGHVVAEQVFTDTLPPGPTVWQVDWDTSIFTETFSTAEDYTILALWTDGQGDIIDTSVRPLSSFQKDPLPVVETTSLTWDFGTITQGEVVEHKITVANTGLNDLFSYLQPSEGLSVQDAETRRLAPADMTTYTVIVDSRNLPVGNFTGTVTIRSNDITNSLLELSISGEIEALMDEAYSRRMPYRPWDRYIWIPGNHEQGEDILFPHGIDTDPSEIQPLKLFDNTHTQQLYALIFEDFLSLDGWTLSSDVIWDRCNLPITQSGTVVIPLPDNRSGYSALEEPFQLTASYPMSVEIKYKYDGSGGMAIGLVKDPGSTCPGTGNDGFDFALWGEDGDRISLDVRGSGDGISIARTHDNAWHIARLVRDHSGIWSMYIDEVLQETSSIPDENHDYRYLGVSGYGAQGDIGEIDYIRITSNTFDKVDESNVMIELFETIEASQEYWMQFGQQYRYPSAEDHTYHVRIPHELYASVDVDIIVDDTENTTFDICFDVGENGVCDWTYSGSPILPFETTISSLADSFNAYIASTTPDPDGTVVVPVRVNLDTSGEVTLTNLLAVPTTDIDVMIESGDIVFGDIEPTEGDLVPIDVTVHNNGETDSGPATVSFIAMMAGGTELFIDSDFIENIPAGSTAQSGILWNTEGVTGDVDVRVVVDPYDRIAETNEINNEAVSMITILTKPDLTVDSVNPENPELLEGESLLLTSVISNTGETDAGAHSVDFLENGTLFGSDSLSIPGESSDVAEATWSPTAPGPYTITVKADSGDAVTESDETNNELETSAYVGFAGSIELDCGGDSAVDPAYTPEGGYGYLNGDATTFCGTEPEQSQRNDWNGAVEYQFDHLLPSHRYHLDIILYECDGLGRQEQVLVDGNLISSVEDLSDGQIHELSFLLDPVMYDDHSIVVRIEELIGYDAVVSQINLHNIDYRYIDAGGGDDPAYSPEIGYGWLDGVAQSPWGDEPYKSRRIDLGDDDPNDDPDNELRYQFDNLDPTSNYELHLTFYQGAGGLSQQSIAIDDIDTGIVVELDGEQRVDQTVYISPSAYADDGSVILRITRTNATAAAFVNELVLEQVTSGVPLAVTDLSISEDAGQVHLEWTDVGRGVDYYEVWRSQSPYFTPGTASAELIAPDVPANPGGTVTYTDATSHLNNPDSNDYYLVLAVKSGRTSTDSNPVAAFDFRLTPGAD